MPADRHQHTKLHSHSTESSPGFDIKIPGHRTSRSLGGRVMSGVAGVLQQVFEYATPSRKSTVPAPMDIDDDNRNQTDPFLPNTMHLEPQSPSVPFYYSSPWLAMIARQCQAVLDSTSTKKPTPPRPRRPPTPPTPVEKLNHPFNGIDNTFEYPAKPRYRPTELPSPISNPPPPRFRHRHTYPDSMAMDDTTYQTPTRRTEQRRHSSFRRAAALRFVPDIELIREEPAPPLIDFDPSRPEVQLHYFHEIMPHICGAFVPVPPAGTNVAPQHLLALYPPAGKGRQTAFTHIIRLLYADEAAGFMPGEGWMERYESNGRCLDVLKLVVPRDGENAKKTGITDTAGEKEMKPQQTTLTSNQLHLTRDFLSLAKPCDEIYQDLTRDEDVDEDDSSKKANQLWRDFSHTLICAPLDILEAAAAAAADKDTQRREADVFDDEYSPPPAFSSCIGEPTDQQRRNVLTIIVVYLAFASRHSVDSVWRMVMFYLKGEYYGLMSAARSRGPKPLRNDRDTMRLWMGHDVSSATGLRDTAAMPKDRVLGVEAVWPGWEVMKVAAAGDY